MAPGIVFRIIFSFFLFLSILYFPFWISAVLALLGMIYFRFYLEAVALALLSDLLYGAPEARFHNFIFVFSLFAVVTLAVIEFVRRRSVFAAVKQ